MGFILTLLGAAGSLINWFLGREQQKIGALKQKSASDDQTIREAVDAKKIEEDVGRLRDSELDAQLERVRGTTDQ